MAKTYSVREELRQMQEQYGIESDYIDVTAAMSEEQMFTTLNNLSDEQLRYIHPILMTMRKTSFTGIHNEQSFVNFYSENPDIFKRLSEQMFSDKEMFFSTLKVFVSSTPDMIPLILGQTIEDMLAMDPSTLASMVKDIQEAVLVSGIKDEDVQQAWDSLPTETPSYTPTPEALTPIKLYGITFDDGGYVSQEQINEVAEKYDLPDHLDLSIATEDEFVNLVRYLCELYNARS